MKKGVIHQSGIGLGIMRLMIKKYWDIKEGIADEMKPFFTQTEKTVIASGRKKIAYALLGVVTVISACYIALVLNPALFPIHLTDDEYLASGIVIAIAFAMVLIGVMLTCCRKTDDTDEELYPEDVSSFDKAVSGEDNLEYLEYEKLKGLKLVYIGERYGKRQG